MSAAPTPARRPGRISRFFSRVFSAPGRLSLAAQAALCVALFLLTVIVVVWIVLLVDPNHVPWRHWLTPGRVGAVLGLLLVIPWIVYRGLRLWLEGERSQFPDIDYAWRAGVEALERNGLSLDATPVFLVLGSAGSRQEAALMKSLGPNLRVRGVPEGTAPLHWYASPDRIDIVCTQAGWLSALSALVEKRPVDVVASHLDNPESPAPFYDDAPEPAVRPSSSMGEGVRGTVDLDRFGPGGGRPASGPPPSWGGEGSSIRGTMVFQTPVEPRAQPHPSSTPAPAYRPSSVAAVAERPAVLAPQDSAEQLQRLQYVCQLLSRARQPLCALNGVLTLIPFESLLATPREVEEVQKALKADLTTVQRTTQLRCPVTALVVGLERERGFGELVRRVGRERATVQRFGRRFDVRSVATPEELEALSAHVCGAFEDWIYTLFREQGALTRPGNTRLYSLLCKVRCNLKGRLSDVLAEGFGYEAQSTVVDAPIALSGCYFAATGDTEDRQAFIQGVLEKLVEEQEDVAWTPSALASDRRYFRLACVAWVLSGLLSLLLVGMIVYHSLVW